LFKGKDYAFPKDCINSELSTFTAPVSGIYWIIACQNVDPTKMNTNLYIQTTVGGPDSYNKESYNPQFAFDGSLKASGWGSSMCVQGIHRIRKGSTASVYFSDTNAMKTDYSHATYFEGFLIPGSSKLSIS
jgi:hypothetical protein